MRFAVLFSFAVIIPLTFVGCDDGPGSDIDRNPPAEVDGRWEADVSFDYEHERRINNIIYMDRYFGIATVTLTLVDNGGIVTGTLDTIETSTYIEVDEDFSGVELDTTQYIGRRRSASIEALYAPPFLEFTTIDGYLDYGCWYALELDYVDEEEAHAENLYCGYEYLPEGDAIAMTFRRIR